MQGGPGVLNRGAEMQSACSLVCPVTMTLITQLEVKY